MLNGCYLLCAFFFCYLIGKDGGVIYLIRIKISFLKKIYCNFFIRLLDQCKKFNVKFTFKSGVCKMPTVESFQGSLFFCLCPVSMIMVKGGQLIIKNIAKKVSIRVNQVLL